MYRTLLCAIAAIAMLATVSSAQEPDETPSDGNGTEQPTPEELKDQLESANERITTLENDVNKLKATKVSGYFQAEWQHFDQKSNAGGRAYYFNATKNFFTLRRGRIKVQHKFDDVMGLTFEADFTERGVGIRDGFLTLNILPEEALSMNVGIFTKPEYEVEVSSSVRENPEQSQVALAFYPAERDLGLMFTSRQTLFENFDPRLQVGIFNGEGIALDADPYKDLMTRLIFPLPLGFDSPVQVDLGLGYLYGGIPQTSDSIIKTVGEKNIMVVNDETGNFAGMGNRQNFNIESQIYLDILPFGGTILKGEFLTGHRPTAPVAATTTTKTEMITVLDTANNVVSIPKTTSVAVAGRPLQIRNQMGYYAYFIQNIENWAQVVVKYDYFDRNTDLTGEQVRSTSDAALGVLDFGLNFFYENMRFMVHYEIPTYAAGENVIRDGTGAITNSEDLKDNKTTVRFQYKF
jgi:hypothetical protein